MVMEVIAAQILIAVTFPWFAWLSDTDAKRQTM